MYWVKKFLNFKLIFLLYINLNFMSKKIIKFYARFLSLDERLNFYYTL